MLSKSVSSERLDVSALGARIRLRRGEGVESAEWRRIGALWAAAADDVRGDVDHDLLVDGRDRRPGIPATAGLSSRVTLAALSRGRGRLVMLHACGIATDDGEVVAFVGPSGRGKTTAVRALGRRFGYVSDEAIAIGEDGAVLPYRKPLSVVAHGGRVKVEVEPDLAGLKSLPVAPLRIAAIALLDRTADSTMAPRIAEVPTADAIAELVPQVSYLRDFERPLQRLAALVDAVGGVRRVSYGEADSLADILPDLLATRPAAQTWEDALDCTAGGSAYRLVADDAIAVEAAVVVFGESTVRVLDGIAPAIWRSLQAGAGLDEIVDAVVAAHGAPPSGQARSLVTVALTRLVRAGVLART